MEDAVARALRRTDDAFRRFRSANTLDVAHDAWEDFLVYWHRAANKIELEAEAENGEGWLRDQIWADPVLKYLRVARNTGDHGLGAVMEEVGSTTSSPVFMMDIGGGIGISSRGRPGILLADGIGMEFVPEALELAVVQTKKGEICNPPIKDGQPMRALELGEIGLGFLTSVARIVPSTNS